MSLTKKHFKKIAEILRNNYYTDEFLGIEEKYNLSGVHDHTKIYLV